VYLKLHPQDTIVTTVYVTKPHNGSAEMVQKSSTHLCTVGTFIILKVIATQMENYKPDIKCSPINFFGGPLTRFVVFAS